ncbi:MAG: DUF2238 domain-containing protein [Patescibacteria group bacterium]
MKLKLQISNYKLSLIAVFAAVWAWSAISPNHFDGWVLENILVLIFVPIVLLTGFYFRLSDLSYTLITVFMILHVIGSHYTYAEVPFGFVLQDWWGASRNMYDRLVHFSFGLLFVYPVREVFVRITKVKGFWGYYLPIELILSFAGFYEIIEWIVARIVDPHAGLAFLGAQGDIWDAQKDMVLAVIGATVTMFIFLLINMKYNPNFKQEFKESLKIPKDDHPLGEEKLKKWKWF